MTGQNNNPFERRAYSSKNLGLLNVADDREAVINGHNKQPFTGGDLTCYINDRRLDNLESLTASISVEVVGNYTMGSRDPRSFTTGKRVVVGSTVFAQWDRHAFLEEVWRLRNGKNTLGVNTLADLWSFDEKSVAYAALGLENTTQGATRVTRFVDNTRAYNVPSINFGGASDLAGVAGLDPTEFDKRLRNQIQSALRLQGATVIRYSDQIPPFDLTVVGVNLSGYVASGALYGVKVTQETFGWSANDMSNAVGMNFLAVAVEPWGAVERN